MSDPTQKKSKSTEILDQLRELTASLRRQPAREPADDDPVDRNDRTLAGRLSVVAHQRTQAEAAATKALEMAEQLRAAHAEELAALKAEAAKSVMEGVRRVEQGYALRAMMADPDDDGVSTAYRLYEAIPENKRPDSIIEWWKNLTPEAAPKTLRAYLPAPKDETATTQTQTQTQARQPPRVDANRGRATEPDPASMDAAAYEAYLNGFAQKRNAAHFGG